MGSLYLVSYMQAIEYTGADSGIFERGVNYRQTKGQTMEIVR